jgi:hypothetical protein
MPHAACHAHATNDLRHGMPRKAGACAVKLVTDAKASAEFAKRVSAWKETTNKALNAVRANTNRFLAWPRAASLYSPPPMRDCACAHA